MFVARQLKLFGPQDLEECQQNTNNGLLFLVIASPTLQCYLWLNHLHSHDLFFCSSVNCLPSFSFLLPPSHSLYCKAPSVHVWLSISVSGPSAHCICVQISKVNYSVPSPSLLHPPSLLILVWVNAYGWQATPGLPKLQQIDDKARPDRSLLFKAKLHLKDHAPCD